MRLIFATFLLASALMAQAVNIDLDAHQSQITWTLNGNVHTVHGTFQLNRGHVNFDPATGSLSGEIVVDAASGESGNDSRDKHMKKDVLETDKYPAITLKLNRLTIPTETRVSSNWPTGQSLNVSGQFNVHGSSHEVAIPLLVTLTGGEMTAKGKFVIPYVDWGMKDPSTFLFKVNKTVEIEIVAVGHAAGGPKP